MGNLTNTIKRFLANRNTVTILGVIVGVVVLWIFYNYRVNKATNPISVPQAKQTITATTEITADMIEYVEVSSEFLSHASVITDASKLIGRCVTTGTSIPEGGLFYTTQVVDKDKLPNSIFDNIPDGYTIFSLAVDSHATYANSIYPGTKIDLYMRATDDAGLIMYGMLINNIEVLAVRDSSGLNVFDQNPPSEPAELLFAVKNDMYELLTQSTYISEVTLVPVPRNKAYSAKEGETQFGSETLKSFIQSKIIDIVDDDYLTSSSQNNNTTTQTENNNNENNTNETNND